MAIKRTAAMTAPAAIKRGKPPASNGARKEDLLGHLLLIELVEYDPAYPGPYGASPRAVVNIKDLDSGMEHGHFWAHTNLAKQIGAWLDAGDRGLGRFTSGPTATGGTWFGVEWSDSDEDFARAETTQ